jgi:hypothetical protein
MFPRIHNFAIIFFLSAMGAQVHAGGIMYMPGLMCGGTTTTASGVGYLPTHNCFLTRASTGTYVDINGTVQVAAANVPRGDYNPVTHAYNGILIENASTNLLPNSSTAFNNTTYWNWNGPPTWKTTSATAPDGTAAMSIVATADYQGSWKKVNVTNATVYTASGYAKCITAGKIARVGPEHTGNGTTEAALEFNCSTGAFSYKGPGVTSYGISNAGSGWWKWYVTFTTTGTLLGAFDLYVLGAPAEIAFWGNQLELGNTATSHIPTTTAPVTRSADVYQAP